MDDDTILRPERIRTNEGSFAFIPHRFLRGGFFSSCDHDELCLYLFFVLAADRHGVSYYGQKKMSKMVRMEPDKILEAVRGLRRKDLVATDGMRVQVLSLPPEPVVADRGVKASKSEPIDVGEAIHAYAQRLAKGTRP